MNIIHTMRPSKAQKADMLSLVASCKEEEPLSLSAPVEDDLDYDILLLYEKQELTAMAFLFFSSETFCECCVFVHPRHRQKGCFTTLLDSVLDLVDRRERDLSHPVDFCFLADERTPSAMAVLQAIGAEYWYCEYKMERALTSKDKSFVPPSLTIREEEDNLYSALLGERVIGTCAVLPCGDQIYLYAFQIHEDFQGQGYGNEFLLGMLAILADRGSKVSLQVSGQNYVARNLYKKTGFQTSEALSYYLY